MQAMLAQNILGGGGGGPTPIAYTSVNGDISGVTSAAINTTGANFIVLTIAQYTGFTSGGTLTDSKGNTWVELANSDAVLTKTRLFYCEAPTVGSGHTFTFTSFGGSPSIAVAAFSGMITSGVSDQYNANNTGVSSWTTLNAGGSGITPSQANTLVVATLSFEYNSGAAITIDSGYDTSPAPLVVPYNAPYDGHGCGLAWKILTAASAQNPTWTTAASSNKGASILASFKY